MNVPIKISFRNVPKYGWIKDLIQRRAGKLREVCPHLSSLRVSVEKTQKYKDTGRPYKVRLDMTVPPGKEIVIKRKEGRGSMHESLLDELEDTFDAAFRRLRKITARQRGQTKRHPYKEPNAFVWRVYKDKGYGFLRSLDGYRVYFHKNSVRSGRFESLRPKVGVHYTEEEGEKGPQARSVRVVEVPEL